MFALLFVLIYISFTALLKILIIYHIQKIQSILIPRSAFPRCTYRKFKISPFGQLQQYIINIQDYFFQTTLLGRIIKTLCLGSMARRSLKYIHVIVPRIFESHVSPEILFLATCSGVFLVSLLHEFNNIYNGINAKRQEEKYSRPDQRKGDDAPSTRDPFVEIR